SAEPSHAPQAAGAAHGDVALDRAASIVRLAGLDDNAGRGEHPDCCQNVPGHVSPRTISQTTPDIASAAPPARAVPVQTSVPALASRRTLSSVHEPPC